MHLESQIRALIAELARMKAEGQELSDEFQAVQREKTRLMSRWLRMNRHWSA